MKELDTNKRILRYFENTYLTKGSAYRHQIEAILRYIFHLDYEPPLKTIDDPKLITYLKRECKSICKQLTNGYDLIFFGPNLPDEITNNGNIPEILKDSIRIIYLEKKAPEKKRIPLMQKEIYRTTDLYEIIFLDSIIEAFHILMHELSDGIYATAYSIFGVKDIFDVVKNDTSINLNKYAKSHICKRKNSGPTDMSNKWADIANIPAFSQLVISPKPGSKAYRYHPLYTSIYNSLYGINLNWIKRVFDPSKSYCFDDIELLENIHKELISPQNNLHNNNVDKIYHCYLYERITNIGLFYSILENIKYVEEKTNYRFGSQDVITLLYKLTNLPNALGRIPIVRFAFDNIPSNTGTIPGLDIMNRMDLSASLPLGLKTPFIPIESNYKSFTFERWLTQVDYMIFFLSNILIPACSWFIVLMLLHSTERNMKEIKYDPKEVYAKAISVLGKYITESADTIMHPIILQNTDRNKGIDLFTFGQGWKYAFDGLDSAGSLYNAFFKSGTPANLSPNLLSKDIYTDKDNMGNKDNKDDMDNKDNKDAKDNTDDKDNMDNKDAKDNTDDKDNKGNKDAKDNMDDKNDDDNIRYLRAHTTRVLYSNYLK